MQKGQTMEKWKSKFNKEKCKTCKYSVKISAMDGITCACHYGLIKETPCLHREGKKIVDRRGEDYNKCLLYERGKQLADG